MVVKEKKVLIVDDESFNRMAMRSMLDIVGLQNYDNLSVDAVNGQVAVDIIVQDVEENDENYCSFDLILMDCNMPVMDGYEATSAIREYLYSKDIP